MQKNLEIHKVENPQILKSWNAQGFHNFIFMNFGETFYVK